MKNKTPIDIGQLEHLLAEKEQELQVRYCQLGKELLDFAESEQPGINLLVDELISLRHELSQARNEHPCPACDIYNSTDSNYCKRCGTALI